MWLSTAGVLVFKYLILDRCIPFMLLTQPAEGCGSAGRDNKAIRKLERNNPLNLHHLSFTPYPTYAFTSCLEADPKSFDSSHVTPSVQISI